MSLYEKEIAILEAKIAELEAGNEAYREKATRQQCEIARMTRERDEYRTESRLVGKERDIAERELAKLQSSTAFATFQRLRSELAEARDTASDLHTRMTYAELDAKQLREALKDAVVYFQDIDHMIAEGATHAAQDVATTQARLKAAALRGEGSEG